MDQSAAGVVTTIRVSGVPVHVTEPDFNCWFLFADGFEQATLQPQQRPSPTQSGWARFSTPEAAHAAINYLNGRPLTADMCPSLRGMSHLSAEIAKKNFKPRNPMKQPAAQEPAWAAQEPMWQQAAPAGGPQSAASPCSTLFAYKLKEGCSEQELRQLCEEYCVGFERLKFVPPAEGRWGMCFLKFFSAALAETALQIVRSYALPSNPGEPLFADFAKADLDAPKRGGPGAVATWSAAGTSHMVPQHYAHAGFGVAIPPPTMAGGGGGQRPNAPCDTMFVGSVAPSVTEEEMSNAMSMFAGFERMKMVGEGTEKAMVFALFDSIQSCTAAIQGLHGQALPSAPYQAVTCQYSKNSLGKASRR